MRYVLENVWQNKMVNQSIWLENISPFFVLLPLKFIIYSFPIPGQLFDWFVCFLSDSALFAPLTSQNASCPRSFPAANSA